MKGLLAILGCRKQALTRRSGGSSKLGLVDVRGQLPSSDRRVSAASRLSARGTPASSAS